VFTLIKKLAVITILFIMIGMAWTSVPAYASALQVGGSISPTVLPDVNGQGYNLGNSIGRKATVIWVTDLCQICSPGLKNMQQIKEAYGARGVDVIIISTLSQSATQEIFGRHQVNIPVLIGGTSPFTAQLTGQSGIGSCPVNNFFIFNRNGTLRFRVRMPGMSVKQMQMHLEGALQ
jgi:peroxiredoxin